MGQPVELVPLRCLKCSQAIAAEPDEVAWVCGQCEQGLLLDETRGLAPLEVHFSTGLAPDQVGKPFWAAQGQVELSRQNYQGGNKPGEEARQFWSVPRLFLVPAFHCSLEQMLNYGTGFLQTPPRLDPGPARRFEPVTLHPEDVTAAAEFIIVAVEAGRADKVKEVKFSLNLSPPELWILPG